jgi:hypothetical protein
MTKIVTASASLIIVKKLGHRGLVSGNKIITAPERKAIDDIIYGKVFGPTGSAKKGDSSW